MCFFTDTLNKIQRGFNNHYNVKVAMSNDNILRYLQQKYLISICDKATGTANITMVCSLHS